MVSTRISITLEPREVHSLEATKYRFLFADKYVPFIPEYKELIQGMLYLTHFTISNNKNSLRSFINAISHRRYSPALSEKELGEEKSEESGTPKMFVVNDETFRSDESSSRDTKSKSYIFTAETEDLGILERITHLVEDYAKLNIKEVRASEIIKEVIGFCLNHSYRNHQFVLYTYIGGLFNMKPSTTLKIFLNRDILAHNVYEDYPKMGLDEDERALLKRIGLDASKFHTIEKKIANAKFPNNLEYLYDKASGVYSEVSDFNYWGSVLGFWLMGNYLPYNMTNFTNLTISSLIEQLKPIRGHKEVDVWDARRDFFIDLTKELVELGSILSKEKE